MRDLLRQGLITLLDSIWLPLPFVCWSYLLHSYHFVFDCKSYCPLGIFYHKNIMDRECMAEKLSLVHRIKYSVLKDQDSINYFTKCWQTGKGLIKTRRIVRTINNGHWESCRMPLKANGDIISLFFEIWSIDPNIFTNKLEPQLTGRNLKSIVF